MKILFSDNTLWGLLNFRIGVIRSFFEQGHTVVLVAPDDGMYDPSHVPQGVKYIPVRLSRTGTNPLADWKYYRALKRIYRAERPDYIFHYTIKPNIYGTLAARSAGIRSSAMIAGLGHVYSEGGIGNRIARAMYRHAMRHPERVMVLNGENRDELLRRRVVREEKLVLLEGGEGIDLGRFVPLPMPTNKQPVFLMICRLLYEKGYAEYVAAAEALRGEAEFRIMGPIDSHPAAVQRETVERDVARGVIEYIEASPDVAPQVAIADCIVLPSYGEGLSRVLMEGLAMGRPLIATDIAGCRETIEEGVNGFLCRPKDAGSLAEAMRRFIALSPEKRAAMGRAGREHCQKVFDEQTVIGVYRTILEAV